MARPQTTRRSGVSRRGPQQRSVPLRAVRSPVAQTTAVGQEQSAESRKFGDLAQALGTVGELGETLGKISLVRDEEAFRQGELDELQGQAGPVGKEIARQNGWYARRGAADANSLASEAKKFLASKRNIRTQAEVDQAAQEWQQLSGGFVQGAQKNKFYLTNFTPKARQVESEIEAALHSQMVQAGVEEARRDVATNATGIVNDILKNGLQAAFGTGDTPLSDMEIDALGNDGLFRESMDTGQLDTKAISERLRVMATNTQLNAKEAGLPRDETNAILVQQFGTLAKRYRLPWIMDAFEVPDKDGHVIADGPLAKRIDDFRRSARIAELNLGEENSVAERRAIADAARKSLTGYTNAMVNVKNGENKMRLDGASPEAIVSAFSADMDVMQMNFDADRAAGILTPAQILNTQNNIDILKKSLGGPERFDAGDQQAIERLIITGGMTDELWDIYQPRADNTRLEMKRKFDATGEAKEEKTRRFGADRFLRFTVPDELNGINALLTDKLGVSDKESTDLLRGLMGIQSPDVLKVKIGRWISDQQMEDPDLKAPSTDRIRDQFKIFTDEYIKTIDDATAKDPSFGGTVDAQTGQRIEEQAVPSKEFVTLPAVETLMTTRDFSSLTKAEQSSITRSLVQNNSSPALIKGIVSQLTFTKEDAEAFNDAIEREREFFETGSDSRSEIIIPLAQIREKLVETPDGELAIKDPANEALVPVEQLPQWLDTSTRKSLVKEITTIAAQEMGVDVPDLEDSVLVKSMEDLISGMSATAVLRIIFKDEGAVKELSKRLLESEGLEQDFPRTKGRGQIEALKDIFSGREHMRDVRAALSQFDDEEE